MRLESYRTASAAPNEQRAARARARYAVAVRTVAAFGRADTLDPERPDIETARLILQVLLPTVSQTDARSITEVLALSAQSFSHYLRRNAQWVRETIDSTQRGGRPQIRQRPSAVGAEAS